MRARARALSIPLNFSQSRGLGFQGSKSARTCAHTHTYTHTRGRKTCGSNFSEMLYIVTLCSKCSRALTLRMLSQRMEDLVSGKAAEHKNDAGPLRELADGIKAITSADSAHHSALPVSQSAAGAWHPRFDGLSLSLPPSLSLCLSLPLHTHLRHAPFKI
jgi:hypothetical protein